MTSNTPTPAALPIAVTDSLNVIIARYPQVLSVLNHFGLDTCCGGVLPLHIAIEHHGLDLAEVLAAVQKAAAEPGR